LVVALQQILINQIALLKRKIKLFLFQDSVSKLRASSLVVLYLGDSSTQLGKLFIAGLPNGKALDIYDPNQLNEFILDNKLKEKVIFVNCNNDFKYSFNTIVPEILVINSQDLNLKDVLQSIPTRTKVVANIDFVAESEITKYHKGEYSLFSGKHHNSSKSGSLITTKYIESEAKGLRVTYSVKGEELTVFLKTLNREYITSYSAFIAVLKELEIDTNKVIKEVERSLPLLSKSIFIEGDNDTKILSFEYQELSYKDFAKNIGSAARHKGQNKLIVITNGLGRKNIPEEFFELAKADADVFITNDQYFNRQLNKRGIRNYHADSFKNAAYLARKYSKEGDIFLIEGVFKDSIIKLLKKN